MTSKQNKSYSEKDTLLPVRYFLDPGEVASCFSALGMARPKSRLFSDLPEANGKLPETVSDKHGGMSREAKKLFDILANPETVMTIETIAANSRYGVQANFVIDKTGTFFAAISREPDGTWDLVLLTGIDQLLSVINELTGLSYTVESSGSYSTTLRISGLAALAAFSDLLRQTQIKSELERSHLSIDHLISPIIVEDLVQMIALAIEKPDMRSVVSKFGYCSDGAILDVQTVDALEMGVQQLFQAGLVDEDSIITGDGLALAKGLSQAHSIASIAAADIDHKTLTIDRLVVIFLPDAILAGVWQLSEDGGPSALTFAEMSAASILSLIREIAEKNREPNNLRAKKKESGTSNKKNSPTRKSIVSEQRSPRTSSRHREPPKPDKKFCRKCGSKLKSGVKFCTNCGAQI